MRKLSAAKLVIKLPIFDNAEACKNRLVKTNEEKDKETTSTRPENTVIKPIARLPIPAKINIFVVIFARYEPVEVLLTRV